MQSNELPNDRLAIAPNAPEQLPRLLQEIDAQGKACMSGQEEARWKLIGTAQSLVHALETPRERILRHCWVETTAFATILSCINLGVFPVLARAEGPKSVQELAHETGAEPELLARLLNHLGSLQVVDEVGLDEYRSNSFSSTLAIRRYSDAFPCIAGSSTPAINALPTWLERNKYRSPNGPRDSPFSLGFNTDRVYFELITMLRDKPELPSQFNNLMSAYNQGAPGWMDPRFYPVQDNLIHGAKTGDDDVFLVDVGGNKGHDIQDFRRKWPNVRGRLVLQDLQNVLDDINCLESSIERMPYDFFTEQTVKGARAYYMHSILHDWNDEMCQEILSRAVAAMESGYSKLLVHENVIPDYGTDCVASSLDIVMMVLVGSKERTENQWRKLIEAVGLRIVNVWRAQSTSAALIECERSV